jgi:predicted RNA-binding protein with PUA domain
MREDQQVGIMWMYVCTNLNYADELAEQSCSQHCWESKERIFLTGKHFFDQLCYFAVMFSTS